MKEIVSVMDDTVLQIYGEIWKKVLNIIIVQLHNLETGHFTYVDGRKYANFAVNIV